MLVLRPMFQVFLRVIANTVTVAALILPWPYHVHEWPRQLPTAVICPNRASSKGATLRDTLIPCQGLLFNSAL